MIQPDEESQPPVETRSTVWWKSAGVLAAGLVLGFGLLVLIALFARPIGLLFLSACIAAALSPLVKRIGQQLPRGIAILIIYGGLLVFVIFIFALVIPPLVVQVRDLSQRLPELLERGGQFLEENNIATPETETIISQAGQVARQVIAVPILVFSAAFDTVMVLIVSLYLLMDAPKLWGFILSLFGGETQQRVDTVGREMAQVAGGYVRGVVINILFVSTVTTIGLMLIGLPFALVLGVIAGLFEALPVVGTLIASVPIVIVAVLQSPTTAVLTIIFVIILQVLQGNIVAPNVMKGQAEVPQFIVPIAILAGAGVGGVLGALIAVPLVAIVRVFMLRVIAPFIRSNTGALETPI